MSRPLQLAERALAVTNTVAAVVLIALCLRHRKGEDPSR